MKMNDGNSAYAVIIAGGSGTRLWPLSRRSLPKQFAPLLNGRSTFEDTVDRLAPLVPQDRVIVVTNKNNAYGAAHAQLEKFSLLIEPAGRNTAPAIGLAAQYLANLGLDPVIIASPSDHLVKNRAEFEKTLRAAVEEAARGRIVTLGIKPSRPETGYGYIEFDAADEGHPAPVKRFIEKPPLEKAREYAASGRHAWNSGIYIFRASVMLNEIKKYAPDMDSLLKEIARKAFAGKQIAYEELDRLFPLFPSISIDYCVAEKSGLMSVIPCDIGWSDIGSWQSYHELMPKDRDGNILSGDVVQTGCSGSLISSTHGLTAAIGLDGTAVIETADAVMVCRLQDAQRVKEITDAIQHRPQCSEHNSSARPWGAFVKLDEGPHHKVKRITLAPGKSISFQVHRKRSEHWTVLSGTAETERNGQKIILQKNQSLDIPPGTAHALANPGAEPLEIIEVQTGEYIGEDDITRLSH